MTGHGKSYGAITVINAMACGIGCTIGTELSTESLFCPEGETKVVDIVPDPSEDQTMAKLCVKKTYERFGITEPEGWVLTVDSDIPISRGLKSSSSACNAIICSVLDSLKKEMDAVDMIKMGVECAKEAHVTVTGSFDDACGCHLGGIVMTDNSKNRILFNDDIEDMDVVIYIPETKIRKTALPVDKMRARADLMEKITELAKTNPLEALTENGRFYSKIIGVDNSFAERALEHGALAAGMTGAGPAVVALTKKGDGMGIARESGMKDIIITHTRRKSI
jgi:shikimate kinase